MTMLLTATICPAVTSDSPRDVPPELRIRRRANGAKPRAMTAGITGKRKNDATADVMVATAAVSSGPARGARRISGDGRRFNRYHVVNPMLVPTATPKSTTKPQPMHPPDDPRSIQRASAIEPPIGTAVATRVRSVLTGRAGGLMERKPIRPSGRLHLRVRADDRLWISSWLSNGLPGYWSPNGVTLGKLLVTSSHGENPSDQRLRVAALPENHLPLA